MIKTDVRVIAATNLDLKEAVRQGQFREDLYYRLNVFPIIVPALRDRLEDIPVFMNHFLRKYCQLHHRRVQGFTSRAITAMLSYKWPGNIRELENLIERGVIMAAKDGVIDIHHLFTGGEVFEMNELTVSAEGRLVLPQNFSAQNPVSGASATMQALIETLGTMAEGSIPADKVMSLEVMENSLIDQALKLAAGNKSAAARVLGITRSQLNYKLSKRGQGKPEHC